MWISLETRTRLGGMFLIITSCEEVRGSGSRSGSSLLLLLLLLLVLSDSCCCLVVEELKEGRECEWEWLRPPETIVPQILCMVVDPGSKFRRDPSW